jgi:elongation factor G
MLCVPLTMQFLFFQSIPVDKQMMEYQLPRLVFVDNLDHKGADPWEVVDQTRSKLQHHSAALQVPKGLGDSFKGLINRVQSKAYFYHVSNGEKVVGQEVPRNMESLVSRKRCDLIKTCPRWTINLLKLLAVTSSSQQLILSMQFVGQP